MTMHFEFLMVNTLTGKSHVFKKAWPIQNFFSVYTETQSKLRAFSKSSVFATDVCERLVGLIIEMKLRFQISLASEWALAIVVTGLTYRLACS